MSNPFFEHPILNSRYEYPSQHWELDDTGQPTERVIGQRREAKFVTPIPKPKKRRAGQQVFGLDDLTVSQLTSSSIKPTRLARALNMQCGPSCLSIALQAEVTG